MIAEKNKNLYPVGIVIVDYKSANATVDFIEKELSKCCSPIIIVVVNVAATSESTEYLLDHLHGVLVQGGNDAYSSNNRYIIACEENTGYARGNNIGAEFLKKQHPECGVYLFSNNDIYLESPDVIEILAKELLDRPEVSMIGPKVNGPSGLQGPFCEIELWRQLLYYAGAPFTSFCLKRGGNLLGGASGHCYWISGCFLMVRSADFQHIGQFDSRTFLGHEEKILAERFLLVNKKAYFVNTVSIYHNSSTVKKRNLAALRKTISISSASLYIYYTYYKHIGPASRYLFRVAVFIHKYWGLPLNKYLGGPMKKMKSTFR